MNQPSAPCSTCGRLTAFNTTKKCPLCWEVEWLLPEYLRSEGGRAFATEALAHANERTA